MRQENMGNDRESQVQKSMIDFLRKKITEEEFERIRNESYEGYTGNNLSSAASESASSMRTSRDPRQKNQ